MDHPSTDDTDNQESADYTLDDDVLAEMARHDPTAFAELYRRHLDRVYRYLMIWVGNVHDAQDLTARTFLAALENIASYRGEGHFSAWLLTIARRKAIDHFRRERKTVPLDTAMQLASTHPSPEEVVGHQLQIEQVMQALKSIAPERAEALALRIFAGLSVTEIGHMMNRSETAVRMLLHRAVRDVRDRISFSLEVEG